MGTRTAKRLTYQQWAARPEADIREELIDGELVVSAMPRFRHQLVVQRLAARFQVVAEQRGDVALGAPIGIRTGDATVVVPDVLYFRGDHVAFGGDDHTVRTVPDIVVEVLSPSTRSHDLVRKRRIFEQHGVPELWYVDPEARRVEQLVLEPGGRYGPPTVHEDGATVHAHVIDGLSVAVTDILTVPNELAE